MSKMGDRPKKATDAQIVQALTDSRGLVAMSAKRLGMTSRAINYRIAKSPKLQEALHEAREMGKDLAEIQMFKAIDAGDMRMVRFFLERQAKDRGYFRSNALHERIERLEAMLEAVESKYKND